MKNKEAELLIKVLIDSVEELNDWSSDNDDIFADELNQICSIIHKMEAK